MRQIQWAVCAALTLLAAPSLAAEDLGRWRYYKVIKLDTTARGAAVKRDVKSFPVAVMLSAANFDFSQVKSDGSDLRFSKTAKGDPLPHAVEYWDKAGQTAALWVKLDVVKGNSRSQSFVMHWGNAEAGDAADAKAVFEAKEGFVGVYHLNEEGSVAEGGYKDATSNEAHMTGVNLKAGSRVDARDLIEMCVEQPPNADLCVVGKTDMAAGSWFHVVAVHDFPKARIYVNGLLEKESTFDVNWISGDHPVGIGNQSQFPEKGRQWDGILDEARALNVAKDGHWIKLDYESQREGTKLLSFGQTVERTSS